MATKAQLDAAKGALTGANLAEFNKLSGNAKTAAQKQRLNQLINVSQGADDPGRQSTSPVFGQDPDNKSPTFQKVNTSGTNVTRVAQAGNVDVKAPAQASAAQIAPVTNASAATINPAYTVNALNGDFSQSNATRQSQMGLAGQLQAQANGTAPSIAGLQLQQALDANQAASTSLARSSNYVNPAVAMRAAIQQNAVLGQQTAAQSAIARLQEQQSGQSQLAGLLSNVRGVDAAQGQADLSAALQAQAGNQQAVNATSAQQAGFQQQANVVNAGAANTQAATQAGLTQNANFANMDAINGQLGLAAQLQQNNNQFNAGQINTVSQNQAAQNTSLANTNTTANASKSNAQTAAGAQVQSAGIYADASKYAANTNLQGITQGQLIENNNTDTI